MKLVPWGPPGQVHVCTSITYSISVYRALTTTIVADSDHFGKADHSGDGKLTFLEWALRDEGVRSDAALAPLAKHWAKFDVEGKGYLTEEEAFSRRARD
jgi:hypothetical protein